MSIPYYLVACLLAAVPNPSSRLTLALACGHRVSCTLPPKQSALLNTVKNGMRVSARKSEVFLWWVMLCEHKYGYLVRICFDISLHIE